MKAIVILCGDKTYLERLAPAIQQVLPPEYTVEGYVSSEELPMDFQETFRYDNHTFCRGDIIRG